MVQPADILILANGPGEITTWVLPVVKALRQQLGEDRSQIRISVILSPCPNATGKEAAIARSYPEVDRVQSSESFLTFLLQGRTAENWDWRKVGVVLFLGGDQFYPVIIGKRLGYRTVVYAEWEARWRAWIDQFAVMRAEIIDRAPRQYRHKFTLVGDLMADAARSTVEANSSRVHAAKAELIGLLPGSKAAKLAQGVPLCLAIAQHIKAVRPQTRFVIPVAPTLELQTLARFADPRQNPVLTRVNGASARLLLPPETHTPCLVTAQGIEVELITQFPAYNILMQCCLCLTTVGANTAELGSLGIPMLVLLPTQQLDAMRSWDGLPGLLANLPGVGSTVAKLINWTVLRQGRLFAWPNKWANTEIVPELVGQLQPVEVAQRVLDYLEYPHRLEQMRDRLLQVRGQSGAAKKITDLVCQQLNRLTGI